MMQKMRKYNLHLGKIIYNVEKIKYDLEMIIYFIEKKSYVMTRERYCRINDVEKFNNSLK